MAYVRHDSERDGRDGIIGLVRETADGLGQLIADHIKLARTEIVADARIYGRHTAVLVIAGFVLALGYGLAWVAAALALSPILGPALAFACVAAFHLVAGVIAVVVAMRRMRRTRLLGETVAAVSRSVDDLSPAASGRGLDAADGAPVPAGRRLT